MNILLFYDRLEAQAVATQLAILQVVTYGNVMTTGMKQLGERGLRLVNRASRFFSDQNVLELNTVPGVTEQVLQKSKLLESWSLEHLRSEVFAELSSRLDCQSADPSRLSTRLIEEAAKGLDIPEDLLLGQQAELIARKYWQDCFEGIRDHLKKEDSAQARETEQRISGRLSEMNAAEKLELQKTLNLSTLSGQAVRTAFLNSGGPLAGIAIVQMTGFGAYLALTTILHALFTGLFGIVLPFAAYTTATGMLAFFTGPIGVALALAAGALGYGFGKRKLNRSQYAMVVWACVTHIDCPLYPASESLPSHNFARLLPVGETSSAQVSTNAIHMGEDATLARLTEEKKQAELSDTQKTHQLSSAQQELARLETRLASKTRELDSLRSQATSTEAVLNLTIELLAKNVAALRNDLVKAEVREKFAKQQSAEAARQHRVAAEKFERKVEARRKEIERLWQVHFPEFAFGSTALRWAAERTFNERLEVERALIELREAPDRRALSRGKMHGTDLHHSKFMLAEGVPARIFYRVSGRQVQIRQILKKNETSLFSATA